ncbi:Hypothetical predicted protein [Paramuricea clavata]|uniref:Uncharacterized protein n=1 Tax=Paramuricea clavata TaxID=317549 RepID=A0A7D9DAV3_PARCT|nr:Hypothetical predicted protein [Paramuricea clavata]
MEINNDVHAPRSPSCESESESEQDDLRQAVLNHEIWDETLLDEVDEDMCENHRVPSVDVNPGQRPSYRMLFNCLMILLAYFWTYFPVPNNAMDFLLLSLKRFFEALAFSNNWFAAFALAFPGSLYFGKKSVLLKISLSNLLFAPRVMLRTSLKTVIELSGIARFQRRARLFGFRIIDSRVCVNPVVLFS